MQWREGARSAPTEKSGVEGEGLTPAAGREASERGQRAGNCAKAQKHHRDELHAQRVSPGRSAPYTTAGVSGRVSVARPAAPPDHAVAARRVAEVGEAKERVCISAAVCAAGKRSG